MQTGTIDSPQSPAAAADTRIPGDKGAGIEPDPAALLDPARPWLGRKPIADNGRPRLTKRLLAALVLLADQVFDPSMDYRLAPEAWFEANPDAVDAIAWIYRMKAHLDKYGVIEPNTIRARKAKAKEPEPCPVAQ